MRDFQRVLLVFLGLLGGANGAAPAYPPAAPPRSLLFGITPARGRAAGSDPLVAPPQRNVRARRPRATTLAA